MVGGDGHALIIEQREVFAHQRYGYGPRVNGVGQNVTPSFEKVRATIDPDRLPRRNRATRHALTALARTPARIIPNSSGVMRSTCGAMARAKGTRRHIRCAAAASGIGGQTEAGERETTCCSRCARRAGATRSDVRPEPTLNSKSKYATIGLLSEHDRKERSRSCQRQIGAHAGVSLDSEIAFRCR